MLIEAAVEGAAGTAPRAGIRAAVEWALDGGFRDADRFEERTLSVLANDRPDGTHVIGVAGTEFAYQLEVGGQMIETAVDGARDALQNACITLKRDGSPLRYRYGADQSGSEAQLLAGLTRLADFGAELYTELVIGPGRELEDELEGLLAPSGVVQVSTMKSAVGVFPWNLVYDHAFIEDPANRLCPEFTAALGSGAAALEQLDCLSTGCSHRRDPDVLCPGGFWGFRHIVEQPLSAPERAGGDLETMAEIPVSRWLNALVGISENLDGYATHEQDLTGVPRSAVSAQRSRREISVALRTDDLHLVYFYCHGGRARGRAWLGVGTRRHPEQIFARYLKEWRIHWTAVHPLVFINGCNTVGIRPNDMADLPGARVVRGSWRGRHRDQHPGVAGPSRRTSVRHGISRGTAGRRCDAADSASSCWRWATRLDSRTRPTASRDSASARSERRRELMNNVGAVAFGLVVGWVTYRTLRRLGRSGGI